jgi:hypothetical protein
MTMQRRLNLFPKTKPLTKTEVYNKLKFGDKLFKRGDFFRWLDDKIVKECYKGFERGYSRGSAEGYSSGREAGKGIVRDNY